MSNSIVVLLDGDGLDEIYHVIDLVLLGLIPSIHYLGDMTTELNRPGGAGLHSPLQKNTLP